MKRLIALGRAERPTKAERFLALDSLSRADMRAMRRGWLWVRVPLPEDHVERLRVRADEVIVQRRAAFYGTTVEHEMARIAAR